MIRRLSGGGRRWGFRAALALGLLWSAPALAADGGGGEWTARLFVIGVGLALLVLGVLLGRVFVLPQPVGSELSWPGRFRRAGGALVAALGALTILSGATMTIGHGDWETDFERGVAAAKDRGGPVIIDFWADWCGACKAMYADTLSNPDVLKKLTQYTKLKIDTAKPENEALWDRFAIGNLPWIVVYDSAEAMLAAPDKPRVVITEEMAPEAFLEKIEGDGSGGGETVGDWLAQKGLLITLLLVFLGGVAVSFTPCVVPVYILTINVIGARRAATVWGRLGLSSVYVLGLALTYSVLGVIVGLSTTSMGAAFQNPWVVGGLAVLFILVALFYLEIFRLPQAGALAGKITQSTHSGVLTAFLLGMAGGLIAAPCVGPMLAGILAYIGTQQDAVLGFGLMFTFALGMGMLFLAIGTSTAVLDRVRKAGTWGYRLEMIFAVVFLAIGLYYLRYAVPAIGALPEWLAELL